MLREKAVPIVYKGMKKSLNPSGIFAARNGSTFLQPEEIATTWQRFKPFFRPLVFHRGGADLGRQLDDAQLRVIDIATLQRRFAASGISTSYYNPETHAASFALPQFIHALVDNGSQ